MSKDADAKATDEQGQGEQAEEQVAPVEATPPEPKPEKVSSKAKVEKPESTKGEGEKTSEKLEQQLSTVQGLLRQSQSELTELRKQRNDFEGLRSTVESQTETLNLITDVLSNMTSDNEELQEKVTKQRQERDAAQKRAKAFGEIMEIAKEGGLSHDSPELEPVREAFTKGDYEGAKTKVFLTVLGKVKDGKIVKPEAEPEPAETPPPPAKKKLPVVTSSPAPSRDRSDLTPIEKIKLGTQEHREND